jgi:hypothetical protein
MVTRSLSILALCLLVISCQTSSNEAKLKSQKSASTSEQISNNVQSIKNAENENLGNAVGIVTEINYPINEIGAITIKTANGTEKLFQYRKNKIDIDSSFIGSKMTVYWSLQIDTSLDEANSYNEVDSIVSN